MEPDTVICRTRAMVLLLTIWMAFHPYLKGFSESLTDIQAEGLGWKRLGVLDQETKIQNL